MRMRGAQCCRPGDRGAGRGLRERGGGGHPLARHGQRPRREGLRVAPRGLAIDDRSLDISTYLHISRKWNGYFCNNGPFLIFLGTCVIASQSAAGYNVISRKHVD